MLEKLKKHKVIYNIGHTFNSFRVKLKVFPNSFRYLSADKIKLHKNNPGSTKKYLILEKAEYTGLMTHMLASLGWIKYALENGYTFVVNTSGDNNIYNSGSENTWEIFYEQPMMSESVDNSFVQRIKQSENYAIAHNSTRYNLTYSRYVPRWLIKAFKPTILFPKANDFVRDEKSQFYWEKLYTEYIHFKPEIEEYINIEFDRVLKDKGKVLGVLVRGSAYREGKPYMHHIQPEMDELIAKIDEFKEKYQWDFIYLATEEEKYEDLLKKQYPGKILTNKRTYDKDTPERHGHQAGLEYLSSMYLLSKCDMLVAGLCGGSQAAVLMNQHNYEHVFLFDIGKYK